MDLEVGCVSGPSAWGTAGYVKVSNSATGHVAADAVRFVRAP